MNKQYSLWSDCSEQSFQGLYHFEFLTIILGIRFCKLSTLKRQNDCNRHFDLFEFKLNFSYESSANRIDMMMKYVLDPSVLIKDYV